MSEIDADFDRAAAAYWLSVASKSTPEKNAAPAAANLLRDARAESRISDSARQPTLNDLEAPPLVVPHRRRLTP